MTSARLLIVDDEPQIRRVMKTALAGEGYEVRDARTGEEAIEILRNERFDLVLLDMNMPGMGGLEACRQIRSTSEIAIVLLTVRGSEADKITALDAGADDYVTKPFGMGELLARLRANLRRAPLTSGTAAEPIEIGNLQLDVARRKLTVTGKEVRLTPKEFDLLVYLGAHPDIPIPHGKLLQAVWGPDYHDEVEYLRTFVNRLRKKIERDPAKPEYLLTEPWIGYRLHVP